jgi:hypothetical protein
MKEDHLNHGQLLQEMTKRHLERQFEMIFIVPEFNILCKRLQPGFGFEYKILHRDQIDVEIARNNEESFSDAEIIGDQF